MHKSRILPETMYRCPATEAVAASRSIRGCGEVSRCGAEWGNEQGRRVFPVPHSLVLTDGVYFGEY